MREGSAQGIHLMETQQPMNRGKRMERTEATRDKTIIKTSIIGIIANQRLTTFFLKHRVGGFNHR